ncbi:MAG: DUF1501 domain-containing protein [Pirellulaceae bacterium]|nr:DUF1501 domain-containing protein [Pirellulaceae bacterium]
MLESTQTSRRTFLRVGGLSALGLGLSQWLALRGRAGESGAKPAAKARRCILIWLDGGPSHLETFDLKPAAPSEVRGPFRPIRTNVPGIEIGEHFPSLAQRMQHAAILRSVTSPLGEHNLGARYLLTGYPPTPALEYPSLGSVVAHLDQRKLPLPRHIAVPNFEVGGQRFGGNGYLPLATRPFEVGGDSTRPDFQIRDLTAFPGLSDTRLARRQKYLTALESFSRSVETASSPPGGPFEQAYQLLASPAAKEAFDLSRESDETRARYGPRAIGQSALVARRLMEAGVPFVTINYPGWDTHQNLDVALAAGFTGAKTPVGLIPSLDLALSALLDDLAASGLLAETLVVVMGEFGRTPKLNTTAGRDHWPRVFSVLLAGGGIRGGQVIGASDATGESPRDRSITPADLAATIFTLLGIDPRATLHTPDGRPVEINRDGTIIGELLA